MVTYSCSHIRLSISTKYYDWLQKLSKYHIIKFFSMDINTSRNKFNLVVKYNNDTQ